MHYSMELSPWREAGLPCSGNPPLILLTGFSFLITVSLHEKLHQLCHVFWTPCEIVKLKPDVINKFQCNVVTLK